MLRGVAKRSARLHVSNLPRRYNSGDGPSLKVPLEQSGGGRGGRKLLMFLSGSLLASGGVLAYASKDERTRQVIEAYVPNSKPVIDSVGNVVTLTQDLYGKISSFTKKDSASPSTAVEPKQPAPAVPAAVNVTKSVPQEKDERTKAAPAPAPAPAPVPVKKTLGAAFTEAITDIDRAIDESRRYIEAVCTSASKGGALSKDEARRQKVVQVEAHAQQLRADISKALSEESTANRDELLGYEHKLDNAIRNLNLVTLEAEALKVYAQHYSEKLEKELSDGKLHGTPEDVFLPLDSVAVDGKLSNKELNQFIAFGYRKLRFLQEELARHDEVAKKSFKDNIENQRIEVEKILSEKFKAELASLEKQLKGAKDQEVAQAELKLNEIHNDQLARQASAHSQHLQDVLESQERYLRAKFESSVQELLALERTKFRQELSGLITRVTAIRKVLDERSELDKLSSKSHQLWVASQALHDEIFSADGTKRSVTVRPFLTAIKSSFGDDQFVSTLVSQFDHLEGDVQSQGALSQRFKRVRQVCRRVAAVSDPPTFTGYLWSYLRSAFVLDPPPLPIFVDNDGNKYVENTAPDTLTILTTAQELLDKNELELCVRLLNQLSGEARNVARDWLADARKLLELRQASNGLLAFAAANSAVGFLTYKGLH